MLNKITDFKLIPQAKPLKGLRNEIPNYVVRLNKHTQAVDTDDVVQWFSDPFNSTYRFLAQINASLSHVSIYTENLIVCKLCATKK